MKLEVSQVIDRSPAVVWRFIAVEHVRNHPRWDPQMELEQVSDGPIGVGTVIRRRNSHSGTPVEGTMEVVEFEPEQAFGVVIHDGPAVTQGRMTLDAEGEGRTRITVATDFVGLDESMRDVLTPLIERSYRVIKELIEAET